MTVDEKYMQRCLELAQLGAGSVSPNPLAGCVIVHNGKIIGEGWHKQYGGAHAEVNAIASVADKSLLKDATVYVNLEPCSHFGKTPPCADLLVKHQVKEVVVGMIDPFAAVSGSGIQKLKSANIVVRIGVLENDCKELNKRFVTFHNQKRPYVILKWAQTADGKIAPDAAILNAETFEQKRNITGAIVQTLVHKWRGEEDAILVGTHTVETDNPYLNTRAYTGKNPVRITFDQNGRLPLSSNFFDGTQPTLVFTLNEMQQLHAQMEYSVIDFTKPIWPQVFDELYNRNIQSLIIEGGAFTLQSVLKAGLWDEAQVFKTSSIMGEGVSAPAISGVLKHSYKIDNSELTIYTQA
jgi:diaminohydroxyphosphoribosylaminopyrimidine deaminase/5-amino-6-(5-phosphoribosylamino)uracil reductase